MTRETATQKDSNPSYSLAFERDGLQEVKVGEVGKRGGDGPSEVVVVEIQAHKALQSSQLLRYRASQVVHVQFPTNSDTTTNDLYQYHY